MPEHYARKAFWSDEDNCYIAIAPAFSGISAFGDTEQQALDELAIVLKASIEIYHEKDWPLPSADSHTGDEGG